MGPISGSKQQQLRSHSSPPTEPNLLGRCDVLTHCKVTKVLRVLDFINREWRGKVISGARKFLAAHLGTDALFLFSNDKRSSRISGAIMPKRKIRYK